jgi:hypothetical protein
VGWIAVNRPTGFAGVRPWTAGPRTGNSSPRWNCTLLPWKVAVVDELERRFGHADVGLNQSE